MVNFSWDKREISLLALVLAVSALVRVLLFPLQGYQTDTNCFTSWFSTATTYGIHDFYQNAGFADYPPFNVYIFWFFGSLANAANLSMAAMVKVVPNLFDLATGLLIYMFVRRQATFKVALLSTALYVFNPAVIYNAAVWGQYDAVYTFFLVLSLFLALKDKPEAAAITFALGILVKPQGIALAPLLILLIYMKSNVKRLLTSIAAFALMVLLVAAPFEWTGGNPITFLSNIYFGAYGGYAVTSANAFNLWGLVGLWASDAGGLFIVGWALFGVATTFTLFVLYKRFGFSGDYLAIFAAFMLLFSFFMLPTRIHERYMFPAISMLAIMFPLLKKTRLLYGVLTATLFVNEAYVLNALVAAYPGFADLRGDPVVLAVSVINLLMLVYAVYLMWNELKGQGWLKAHPAKEPIEVGGTT
ncbi:MAG: glycosyltransferase family 39 protein [Candidatus Bathyarchaeota archaeon]|nr:glycosyltransferase family 39 protein [Candidatus Bathyarchaeota archaeon]